jgi:phosphatidylserine/phosphatidylglycerophosphate/cardiolipin synthase-like enzyme
MRFLTTKQISGEIERVIREADNFIIIISPYVKVSQLYIDRLKEAGDSNVKIHFVFGKEQIAQLEENKFANLPKLKMHYLENLHAKCYLNENIAIITSMNLYKYSEINNREMGILIEKKDDEKMYNEISREANSVIQNAEPYYIRTNKQKAYNMISNMKDHTGFCIRCREEIKMNPEKPLCPACYDTWSEFFNYEYSENFCHLCGNETETSMAKPLCYTCFKSK